MTLAFVSAMALCSCAGKKYQPQDYVLQCQYKNDFRILQLTDIHMSDKDNQKLHYDFMDLTIREANADMIIVTGDLFTFASQSTAKGLFNFLDSYGIPWTVIFGNHDEQCYFSVEWLTGYLNNYGSNCLFKDIQDDDVFGNCNFVINLMEGNNIHDQLFIMDSNRYTFDEYFGYDYFKPDQIEWYKNMVEYTTAQNGGAKVNSLMFYHIPLPEIDAAYDEAEANNAIEFGEKREKTCPPEYNSGFFQVIKDCGSTKAMFFGHDHRNDFRVTYQGVTFCYGIKSTDRIYFDNDMMGGQVITIHDDHSLSYQQYFHTYEEVQ